MIINRSLFIATLALSALAAPQIASAQDKQQLPGGAAFANPFAALFDKDPNKTDSEIRYNHQNNSINGIGATGPGGGLLEQQLEQGGPIPADQGIRTVDGVPTAGRHNAVSGVEWEDMNRFSKQGAQDFPEDKLRNELKKPMPDYHPFGDRMKEISNRLKNEAGN